MQKLQNKEKFREIDDFWCASKFIPREKWGAFLMHPKFPREFSNAPFILTNFLMHQKLLHRNLYSKPCVNILLHDHFEGCNEIANPKGQQFFIPRGEAPRDEKLSPEGFSNFIASRKMIVQ
jgi:hypothetical protein